MQRDSSAISVLHVDDDPDFADLTADMLERNDGQFRVATETSVSDGFARLTEIEGESLAFQRGDESAMICRKPPDSNDP